MLLSSRDKRGILNIEQQWIEVVNNVPLDDRKEKRTRVSEWEDWSQKRNEVSTFLKLFVLLFIFYHKLFF